MVTRVAREARVRARQRKLRLRRMIERPVLPAARVVAGRAVRAQRATVLVVLSVAVDAGNRRVLEARRGMAILARHG